MQNEKTLRRTATVAVAVGGLLALAAVSTPAVAAGAEEQTAEVVSVNAGQVRGNGVLVEQRVGQHRFEVRREGARLFQRYVQPGGALGGEDEMRASDLDADEFDLQVAGNWTDAHVSNAVGRVGADVVRVVFHTVGGTDAEASIGPGGYWVVAFKSDRDFTPEWPGYRATVTLADGSSYDVEA